MKASQRSHTPRPLRVLAGLPPATRAVVVLLVLTGCATELEQTGRRDLNAVASERASNRQRTGGGAPDEQAWAADGSLASYVRYALENSPVLRARFQEWRAAALQTKQARKLPEPVITYAYFVRRVETRLGPQRHRFG
ncbi:MAG: hypothetical protein ACOC1F_05815, partial [Myxococcota bacterium]